jgi:hypothetical protein
MNIDDILDFENSGTRSQEESHSSPKNYSEASISSSYPSFLNPHAPEFGRTSYGMRHESTEFSRPISSSYLIQGPEESLYQSQPLGRDTVNDHIGYNTEFPYSNTTVRNTQAMSRSQDYFDDYGSRIHQQRPKQFADPSLSFPSTGSSAYNPGGSYHGAGPVRTRSMGNVLSKTSSFRGHSNNAPARSLASYSDAQYQSQFAFSLDPALSLSSFGEEVHGYSPVRTPNSISSASMSVQYPAPTLSVGPVPPSSSTLAPGKSGSKDQKRSGVSIDGYIYQVQFKRAHRHFVLAPSAPRDIIPGDFVKVEADRGEDMGIVLAKIPADSFEEVIPTAGYRGRGFSSGQGERKFLYRRATAEERSALALKVADEERALETIREKSKERALPMKVLDAEYQFDRHKLTFYFEADKRIDFRDLVSELFSQYKTRIWMQQVDTSSLPAHDPGMELARATGFLPPRDDDFAGYGRTPSFGSATTLTTLDTHDTAHHSISKQSEKQTAAPAVASAPITSALSSSPTSSGLISDPWGNYRF